MVDRLRYLWLLGLLLLTWNRILIRFVAIAVRPQQLIELFDVSLGDTGCQSELTRLFHSLLLFLLGLSLILRLSDLLLFNFLLIVTGTIVKLALLARSLFLVRIVHILPLEETWRVGTRSPDKLLCFFVLFAHPISIDSIIICPFNLDPSS